MRFGIDGYPLVFPKTGIGHYTFELATELARIAPQHSFELVAPDQYPKGIVDQLGPIPNLVATSIETNLITRRWWAVGLPRYLRRARFDLFHGTNYDVPLGNRERNVLTVHDLSIFTHRDTHEKRIARRARRRFPIMLRAAARIITPTESVKRAVVERFKIDPEMVAVTPEAPRTTFRPIRFEETLETRSRLRIEGDFILFVGTIEPRKNLLALMRAFDQILRQTSHRPQLALAGGQGWLTGELDRFLAQAQFGDRLRMIGYADDDDLRALYSSCTAFVYPSLDEGFGLPPLEAMACGAPVIASRLDAHVETLGGNAKLMEPTDETALAQAIVDLLENQTERERLAIAGVAHAAKFSWEKTARLTLGVYEELLATEG